MLRTWSACGALEVCWRSAFSRSRPWRCSRMVLTLVPLVALRVGGLRHTGRGGRAGARRRRHGSRSAALPADVRKLSWLARRRLAAGPELQGSGPAAWDFYLRTGRMPLSAPGQPSYLQQPVLTEDQIEELEAYGATIGSAAPAVPNVVVDVAQLNTGRDLFINNCAACHGAAGTGGSIGGGYVAPSIAGHDPTTLAEAVLVGPGPMPKFDWSSQQLSAVATYVQYLGHAASPGGTALGGYGPVPEGLIAVVVGLTVLVGISIWVATGGKRRGPFGLPGGLEVDEGDVIRTAPEESGERRMTSAIGSSGAGARFPRAGPGHAPPGRPRETAPAAGDGDRRDLLPGDAGKRLRTPAPVRLRRRARSSRRCSSRSVSAESVPAWSFGRTG